MTATEASGPVFYFGKTSPFSHFYPRPFVVNGITFWHMEGFLMFCKAMLFRDLRMAEQIRLCKLPDLVKKMGRQVANFDDAIWTVKAPEFAFQGNVQKFRQHLDLCNILMETGQRELVEASPWDRLWGIGMGLDDPNLMDRTRWGQNRHGKTLMRTRKYFQDGF